ncbi:hypothetical protein [Streptomyces beihaiensis]|uniref:C2H2-type domain-containing protein n=1 Tax=Streptomyces beihaiensis TaxID=2984495 RepID=A0ABT3TRD7_9ACTN|nr:hypothetical protein [Streptomyces beihaiensis]MCX3059591.1 hypothetical protein [Streptomyces beihaiensis]
MPHPMPRLFVLRRDQDVTGVSGRGDVADGVQWPDGTAVLRWRERPSTAVWDSLDLMLSVHGHDGATRVVWAEDEAQARHDFTASILNAYDLPASALGAEAERAYLHRQILRTITAAWETAQASHGEAKRARADLTDAVMPIVGQVLDQRDRAQAAAGRAYQLADRWRAAHGAAMCPVRAAGVELRDELDGRLERDDDMDDVRRHYLSPDMQPCTKQYGRAERQRYGCNGPDPVDQEPPNQGPLTGIEVRDPCPYCEGCPLIPRVLMDGHIREHHQDVVLASHENGSPAANEATGAPTCEEHDVIEWACIPNRQTGETLHYKRVRPGLRIDFTGSSLHSADLDDDTRLGANDHQACPYCTGGPQFLRSELGAHVQEKHARVLAALAVGALDEQLADPETRCTLPHEMET